MTPDPGLINLPHAATIVGRLILYVANRMEAASEESAEIRDLLDSLERDLEPYVVDPPLDQAASASEIIAREARRLADAIVRSGLRGDRLGQCVRNLFECLGLPEEGAAISLECGERPDSPLRP